MCLPKLNFSDSLPKTHTHFYLTSVLHYKATTKHKTLTLNGSHETLTQNGSSIIWSGSFTLIVFDWNVTVCVLCSFLMVPRVGLLPVIMACPGHIDAFYTIH